MNTERLNIDTGYALDALGVELNAPRHDGETDADYRIRLHARYSRYATQTGSQADLVGNLFNFVQGVKRVDVLDAPPGFVHARVQGGEDRLIAWTLYNGLSAGIRTKGNTSYVIDCNVTSQLHRIRFSRPRWYHLAWWSIVESVGDALAWVRLSE